MTNWLITGGCGFIGTNLISELTKDPNNRIRVLDNLSTGCKNFLGQVTNFVDADPDIESPHWKDPVYLIEGDIMSPQILNRCLPGTDIVVHLAANTGVGPSVENPLSDCNTNVIGTLNTLEAARHNSVKSFVFASSGAPLGEQVPPLNENLVPHPASPYGASKLAGEGYCSAYHHSFGLNSVVLRFGNVYGGKSEMKDSVVAKFIKCALSDIPFEVYGNGEQTRDFIYVEDLVRAICFAGTKRQIGGEIFQIASSTETKINEIIELMQKALVAHGLPLAVVKYKEARVGDVKRNFSDTSKAKRILGWEPLDNLTTGLEKTIKYYTDKAREETPYGY